MQGVFHQQYQNNLQRGHPGNQTSFGYFWIQSFPTKVELYFSKPCDAYLVRSFVTKRADFTPVPSSYIFSYIKHWKLIGMFFLEEPDGETRARVATYSTLSQSSHKQNLFGQIHTPPGTSIFLPKVCWKIFLFPRCDMLVPWRVCFWHEIPPQSIFESAKISRESQRLEFFRLSRWPVQVWPIFVQENRWMNFDKSCLLETFQTLVALFGVFVHPPMVLPAPCPAFSGLVRAGLGPRTPSRAGTFFLSIGI